MSCESKNNPGQMRQVAFAYLTKYRPTSGKLRQYLLRKNYQSNEINTLINELCELKYLDDYAAAERILHLCRHSGAYGKIGLQALLLRKGVEYNCAQVALRDFFQNVDEHSLLEDYLSSTSSDLLRTIKSDTCDYAAKQKILRILLRRATAHGFSVATLRNYLRDYMS